MIDHYGRNINKLRVSVGEACNFSCIYCVEEVGGHQVSRRPLTTAEMLTLIGFLKTHAGIEKIRITGGEPLLYRKLPELIQGIVALGISKHRYHQQWPFFSETSAYTEESRPAKR